jgi:hypothetical protein
MNLLEYVCLTLFDLFFEGKCTNSEVGGEGIRNCRFDRDGGVGSVEFWRPDGDC